MLKNLPELFYEGKPALPPQEKDLQRLYDLIVQGRHLTVLEFGCGYSTFVIAEALEENRKWFNSLPEKPEIRNENLFEVVSIDTNKQWIAHCAVKLSLYNNYKIYASGCEKTTFKDQICHRYYVKSYILPDFIYLDGPDPEQVMGWNWNMPMSADLLYIEPILIPGTKVLIDGRTNNARFLARNLQREWKIEENLDEDYTLMELIEPRLGKINAVGRDVLEWTEKQK